MARGVDHDVEFCSKFSRCAIYRWAADCKVSLYNNTYFCPACNICARVPCHKLLRHKKDVASMKKDFCYKFINEQKEKKEGHVPLLPTSDARAEMDRISRGKIA